jgi:DNA polymerase I-like protein with 3'-5' exonuclease and polymerase domains
MREKYNLVDTVDKLRELDKILMDGDKPRYEILAYDTETNGLNLHKTTVVGFSISFDSKSGYYIPILKWKRDEESLALNRSYKKVKYDRYLDGKLECVWTGELFDEFVLPSVYNLKERFPLIPALVQRWLGQSKLIMHNAPFDINHTFINMGVDLKDQLFVDTGLLLHILNENESTALKKAAERYKTQLGINPHASAAMEKKELDHSIIVNGATPGHVWRADLNFQSKYACADTFLTYGIYEVIIREFAEKFGAEGLDWFFNKEVMPVCKEVVIDMKRNGVYIDVPYFEQIHKEIVNKMESLEDQIIDTITEAGHLKDFSIGKSIEEEVSEISFRKELLRLENLPMPTKVDKKTGKTKETLAKGEVKKMYNENPHWVWGYILGEDEIKYSDAEVKAIKLRLYQEKVGRRHRFNIGSTAHLRWLFCDKLGEDKTKLPQTDSATKDNPIPQMGADVLREFMLPKYPWVATLISYKKMLKLESTYIRPALVLNVDGWMYMDMKQNGTTSGRFSCSGGYNLQTLPRVDDEFEALNQCDSCYADRFNKDGSETGFITIKQEIECIADRVCNQCGHEEKDIPRPSAIKKGFIAPPGYKIVNADYSSLEPRCFAYMSGEDAIKEVYAKGFDLYSQVYCEIFDHNKEYSPDPKAPNFLKAVAPAKRKFVKPIVLGIPYGSGDAQVASMIDATKEVVDKQTGELIKIPDVKEGKRVRDAYLTRFSSLNKYMEDQDFKAVTLGYVETIVGRRRHLPYAKVINDILLKYGISYKDIADASKSRMMGYKANYTSNRGQKVQLTEPMLKEVQDALSIRDEKLKEKGGWAYIRSLLKSDLNNSKNNPIQGLAGSITNVGMLDTNRYFKQSNIDAWVMLQVHDEIGCYAKVSDADKASECLRSGMENNWVTKLIDVKMIADPLICDNLKDAK